MAFPKLSDREIFGLFDSGYEFTSVLGSYFNGTDFGSEIYFDIAKIIGGETFGGAFGVGADENLERESLHPDFDEKTMTVENAAGEGALYKAYQDIRQASGLEYFRFKTIFGFASQDDHFIRDADPYNFIQKFVVPKVEDLVDVNFEDLKNIISEYMKVTIAQNYYFETTIEKDKGGVTFSTGNSGGRTSRQNVGEITIQRSKAIRSQIETMVGKTSAKIIVGATLKRNHWDGKKYVFDQSIRYLPIEADDVKGSMKPFFKFEKSYEASGVAKHGSSSVGKNIWFRLFVSGDIHDVGGSELTRFLDKLSSTESKNFPKKLTPEELARIIMVKMALKVLSIYTNEVLVQLSKLDDDEDKELLADTSKILEAAKKEVRENPDGTGFSEQDREKMEAAIKRGFQIRPQCLLVKNVLELAKLNRKRLNAVFSQSTADYEIDYKYTRMISNPSNTASIINKLTKRESQENLLKMRPHHLARMVPYLRLYKVITDSTGNTNEIEFKFPNFTNVSSENKKMDILEGITNKFTQEYGITSFNWKFIGSDPFSYANDIEASLSIHFSDFEQLMVEREGVLEGQKDATMPKKKKYRMLDLVSISELEQAKLKEVGSRFDIRVDVGWSGPSDSSQIEGYNTESSIRTMFLVMTDYDISFNEEGHFELIINYKSRLEQALYDRKTNILVPGPSAESQISSIEDEIEQMKSEDNSDVEALRKKEQDLEQIRIGSKQEAYQNIFNFLLQNNSVYSQNLTQGQLFGTMAVKIANPQDSVSSSAGAIFGQLSDQIDKIKESNRNSESEDPAKKDDTYFPVTKDGEDYILNYFFLGDLVESLAQRCFEHNPSSKRSNQEQKFLDDTRIVLTDFLLYDPNDLANKNILKINIGDIPISVELFMSFYYERVVKYNVGSYSLMKFIRDIISYCITNIFEDCFGEDNLKSDIKTGFIDFKKDGSKDPFESYAIATNNKSKLKLGSIELGEDYKFDSKTNLWSSIAKAYLDFDKGTVPQVAARDERANCIHACVISAESFEKSQLIIDPNYEAKKAEDISAGLYHLDTGSGRGILKKINFSKTDQKYLREQRFTQDEAKGFSILSNVFDVNMSLVGNTLFFPGQRVFIKLGERFSALDEKLPVSGGNKTKRLGETFATTMGLGGYHLVISVENEISTSGFTTNLVARYEWHGREVKDTNPLQNARNVSAHALHSTPSPD